MLTFRQFIYLTEAKAQDIIRGIVDRHMLWLLNKPKKDIADEDREPHIGRATKAYNEALKHKVNPSGFKTIDELERATAQVKQASESDIQIIHHNPKTGVTIKQVNTKNACIKGYGHGKTNWCVAATGKGNDFERYGKRGKRFFTIHYVDTETGKETVYGAHEHETVIRDVHNKSVKPHDAVYKAMAETPQLSVINVMTNNPHTTGEHITNVLEKRNDDTAAKIALEQHKRKITQKHMEMAMVHPFGSVAITALAEHKRKRKPHLIDMAMKHPDGNVAVEVLKYHADMTQPHNIDMAMEHPEDRVAETALVYHKDKIQPHHEEIARLRGLL